MFVHLHCHSLFSFLDGASRIKDLVNKAATLNMPALAITDHNNLCAAVQFSDIATQFGIKPIIGVELTIHPNYHLVLLAKNNTGYANLCRIITRAHLESERENPRATISMLEQNSGDIFALSGCRRGEIATLILNKQFSSAIKAAKKYKQIFKENFFLEIQRDYIPYNDTLVRHIKELAELLKIPIVATNNCHFVNKNDFQIHDLLTCARTLTSLLEVHPERRLNAENYLKSPAEMVLLFPDLPRAISNTLQIAEACKPALPGKSKLFPGFEVPAGTTPENILRELTYKGALRRYEKITPEITNRLEHELDIINDLGYADYFLMVWDLVHFARANNIRYAGRGSAADSAVAYCLGITEVDAISRRLLFERFMSKERAQSPDIDIDFDARYRDKVTEYVYKKYGAEQVATVCTYNTFRARSAIRDMGKAMGFPLPEIEALSKRIPYHLPADGINEALGNYPELRESRIPFGKYRQLFDTCTRIAGFPRFIGTHLGGIVVCREPLTNIVPLQQSAKKVVVTQYDKDYIEKLGLLKLDLLSLRMLSSVEDTVAVINSTGKRIDYDRIQDEPETYKMLQQGDSIGVFQLESPAQRALQQKLQPSKFEDLVASVALIRPGPIKGNMVCPYVARRKGEEPVTYIHPELQNILDKTFGVVLFQEQIIEIATILAGFSPGEGDKLRKTMSKTKSKLELQEIGIEFKKKAISRGVSEKLAREVFDFIAGYAGYGFCEAHAAAFASTAYKTAYLLKHHPTEFYAALLNNQPMGYYSANTLCNEARRRDIKILPVDINASGAKFDLVNGNIRVPLSRIKGISKSEVNSIIEIRRERPFNSFNDFKQRTQIHRDILVNLILCGAFDPLEKARRPLLWNITSRLKTPYKNGDGLFHAPGNSDSFTLAEKIIYEYKILGLTTRYHLMDIWRQELKKEGILTSSQIKNMPDGSQVKGAGMIIRPHRPPTKSGKTVVFFSLEDETGLIEVTVFSDVYQKFGAVIFGKNCFIAKVSGEVQNKGNGTNIIAKKLECFFD